MKSDLININGEWHSKKQLCIDWFKLSNDAFYRYYGFNFNPFEYEGLYEWGKKQFFGEGSEE